MKYAKGSPEFEANLFAMHEMEDFVPMTRSERDLLHNWAWKGHDIDSNPWNYYEPNGSLMGFLKALRIRCGCSHGPWDSWEYENFLLPDESGFPSILY